MDLEDIWKLVVHAFIWIINFWVSGIITDALISAFPETLSGHVALLQVVVFFTDLVAIYAFIYGIFRELT